jgi:predicted DNA binding CopG/RHH family protein
MEAKMNKQIRLDSFERGIEKDISGYTSMKGSKLAKVEQALEKAKKTRNINIRINEHDLAVLKSKAASEGIPYQTLISSVLHKFVSDRLVDEQDILKSMQLLESRG